MAGDILIIILVLAALSAVFGGKQAASSVLGAPITAFFRGIGWVLRGILGTFGSAIVRVIADIHSYCYSRQPGLTVIFYLILITSAVILVLFYQ